MKSSVLLANAHETDLLKHILTAEGYEVIICKRAQEAFEYLRNHTPKLMMIDNELPDMSGLSLCHRLKKVSRLKDIPVILNFSNLDERKRTEATMAKVDRVTTGNFESGNIRATVSRLIYQQAKTAA